MELVQIRFIVRNFPATFRFYRDVLGLVPQVDDERGPYGKLTLPDGSAAIALQARADVEALVGPLAPPGDASLVALRVPDLAAAEEAIRSRGGSFLGPPRNIGGRLLAAHLRDPEGNLLELQEWLAPRR